MKSVDLATVEVLVGPRSEYAEKTLEEMDFRTEYGFTVLGISREGKAIPERPMETVLEFGDSLLLLGHMAGVKRLRGNQNLILLGEEAIHPVNISKVLITLGLLAGVVTTAVLDILTPAISIPTVAMLVILFRCIDLEGAYRAVDWQAVFTTAGMIPFGSKPLTARRTPFTGSLRPLGRLMPASPATGPVHGFVGPATPSGELDHMERPTPAL